MSFRRVNRSKKVPGVKLRPAASSSRRDLRTPESAWTHSSGLDSDEETIHGDLCPRPFKGLVICATGINDKTSLFKLAVELGAGTVSDLTDRVTHLIAEEPGSAKYRCALENRIPIMHPSWITESHKVWLRGDDVDVAESIKNYRLPPFSGVVLCVSGIEDVNRRMEINREVTNGGGTYVKHIERPVRVTHLLCANTSEGETEKVRYAEKFNRMGEARIHIVWEDWFWDSLRFGGRFDEEAYKVSNPRPPPKLLPEAPPTASCTTLDEPGVSSEIQNIEASAVQATGHAQAGPSNVRDDEEEIASVKRVPALTLHLWESILKPRGFEVQQGRLIRSPSKSQFRPDTSYRREPSPSSRAGRRGSLKDGDGEPHAPASALSSFRRARSFAPATKDISTPLSRQPFRRAPTVGEAALVARTSSFLSFRGGPVGSVQAAGGISSDLPIASTSVVAGPSRAGSVAPDNAMDLGANGEGMSEGARDLFKGVRIRALGEAKCASVRRAIEDCGGTWVNADDDDESVDFIIVRLVSGSAIFRQEGDEAQRAKYRTECWLERCIFEERICPADDHVAFVPLGIEAPVAGTEDMVVSYSGLDQSEACWVRRLLRALGITHAPNFSRRTTHLLCPSGEGPKADKAREWGTPIIDMEWLACMARTNQIPATPASSASSSSVQQGEDMDLQVVDFTRKQEVMLPTQQHSKPSKKGDSGSMAKGKGKARDIGIVDITNEESAPHSQSLSYLEPPEVRPADAQESESFGVPSMLLGEPGPNERPGNREDSAIAPGQREVSLEPTTTQPSLDVLTNSNAISSPVSIPARLYDDRVPSSESPSPMRMPGAGTPSTPARVAKQATKVLQESITTLLGKRPAAPDAPEREHEDEGRKAKDARLGKRARPLNRTKSNMSFTEAVTPGRSTPVPSPGLGARSRGASTTPAPVPEHDLVPLPEGKARSAASGDEADNSFMGAEIEESTHVMYADPKQSGVRERLKNLFDATGSGGDLLDAGGPKDKFNMEIEMTLPQLPDVAATTSIRGRRQGARGRRGRRAAR
ncbi:hypothetical protein PYCCODRAFT_1480561 [Trametes coccinea BRFM310]|uniref:BRCT domain-containing protein n=1 Tax=Trametes coccinea (strain BRFM310) TaxID=1353009 RepID=A0A1Y2IDP1_TRAC3|nr:hypothetical protein PYCCODRAFT_1480561 [Trametes coccinea BRFM310]